MMFMLDGRPVSGSLSIRTPSFTLNRPSGLVVFQIGYHARAPEHRDRGCRTGEPVDRIAIDARRVAHQFDGELRRDAARRPWHADAKQTAIQQQRMRTGRVLRQARVVRSVDRSKDRIASLCRTPARGSTRPRRSWHSQADDRSRRRAHSIRSPRRTDVQPCQSGRIRSTRPTGRARSRTPSRQAMSDDFPPRSTPCAVATMSPFAHRASRPEQTCDRKREE